MFSHCRQDCNYTSIAAYVGYAGADLVGLAFAIVYVQDRPADRASRRSAVAAVFDYAGYSDGRLLQWSEAYEPGVCGVAGIFGGSRLSADRNSGNIA